LKFSVLLEPREFYGSSIDWFAAVPPLVLKASGFLFATKKMRGFASGRLSAHSIEALTESQRLSARAAAQLQ